MTPEFSHRAGAVLDTDSPYWSVKEPLGDKEYEDHHRLIEDEWIPLQEACQEADDYDDLKPNMRSVFDRAEAALLLGAKAAQEAEEKDAADEADYWMMHLDQSTGGGRAALAAGNLATEIEPATALVGNNAGSMTAVLPATPSIEKKPEDDGAASDEVRVDADWHTLRRVVVGRIDNDVFAPVPWQPSVKGLPRGGGVRYADFAPKEWRRAVGQLDALAALLEGEGVEVLRPPLVSAEEAMQPPVGLTQVYAREAFSVVGTVAIVNQCRTPYRRKEARAAEALLDGAAEVLRLPPAPDDVEDSAPDDPLPYLEGGDVFRIGKDVLITMSGIATSPAGFRFVADELGARGYEVWPGYLDEQWEHGDYVLMLVREGLCLAHRRAFRDGLLPAPLTDWDCVEVTAAEADPGMAANGIVLRENLVVLPAGNRRVVRALERRGVDVIEVEFGGVAFFQGAVDCATSELLRGDVPSKALSTDKGGREHRDKGKGGGQFVKKGGGGDGSSLAAAPDFTKAAAKRGNMMEAVRAGKGKDAQIVLKNGKPAPDHITAAMVPPDWSDVLVCLDPDAELLVRAVDGKGRSKLVYSDKLHARTAALKFARVDEMIRKTVEIDKEIQAARSDPKTKEHADCAWLMSAQATRPGSKKDIGAKVKAYGATTLEGRHVVQDADGTVRLHFVGKEGVQHDHRIHDKALASMLLERKKVAGDNKPIFKTSEGSVNNFIGKLDGKHFSAKDFRTRRANLIAARAVAKIGGPAKDEKQFKARVKAVAYQVSTVLGNKPAQCLESYINPIVFSTWIPISRTEDSK